MRFHRLIQVVFCSLFLSSCSGSSNVTQTQPVDTDGHTITAESFEGKWVVLNYWADWCEACMQEVPELNQFYQDEKGKNVIFYGVNYDGLAGRELTDAIDKSNIQFPVAMGDFRSLWDLSRVEYLPTTFIIDPNGKVVQTLVGPSTEKALLDVINSSKS